MKKFFSNPWTIGTLILLAIGGIVLWMRDRNGDVNNGISTREKQCPTCCIKYNEKPPYQCIDVAIRDCIRCGEGNAPYGRVIPITGVVTDGNAEGNVGVGVGNPIGGLTGLAGGGFISR